jgi:hypothetical protein
MKSASSGASPLWVSKQEALRAEAAGGPDPVHSGPVMHLSQPLGVNCTTRHQT